MNVDSSYMQYINSLMNEDGFELPGGRRFSIGSYSSDVEVALDVEEFVSGKKDRTFSWGDAGFEEVLSSLGRQRAFSEMSADSDFISQSHVLMLPQSPPDGAARRQVQLPPLPLPKAELSLSASQFPINHMNANYHIQYPQHMQLLLRNSSFVSDTRMMSFKPSDNDKVGAYTRQERREKIAKYRSKRALRVFRKQVKYDCRKKLADTRPRVKGRFVTKLGDDGCDDKFPPADNAAHPSGHAETSCESFA